MGRINLWNFLFSYYDCCFLDKLQEYQFKDIKQSHKLTQGKRSLFLFLESGINDVNDKIQYLIFIALVSLRLAKMI